MWVIKTFCSQRQAGESNVNSFLILKMRKFFKLLCQILNYNSQLNEYGWICLFLKKRERKKRNPQSCKLFLVAIWWLINSRKNYNKSRTNKKQPKAIIFCGTKTAPWRRKTNNAHEALMTSTRKGARWISFEMLSNAETKIRRTGKKCLILCRKILKK